MPYINGRYHMNPTMGQALEAARDAEAALVALQQHASPDRRAYDDNATEADPRATKAADNEAPIHRVEIDTAELVPSSSGHASRGFVARVHRAPAAPSPAAATPAAETHVFTDHRDLANFLRDSLAPK